LTQTVSVAATVTVERVAAEAETRADLFARLAEDTE
jgi:hypothetical protein